MLKIEEIKNSKIFLDTNILIHYATQGFKERSGNPLRVLINNGNQLITSDVVVLELFQSELKGDTKKKYESFLKLITTISPNSAYFNNAATLSSHYRKFCGKKSVPFPDLVIGGTVIASYLADDNFLLMTADRNDFCEPLWISKAHHLVLGENGNESVNLYLLEFNVDLFE